MPFARDVLTWSKHVRNAEAYSAEDFIIGAPGLFAHLQLFNPLLSGIRVRMRSVHLISNMAISASIRRYDPPGVILGPPAPFIIENLLGGGAPAVAEVRHDNIIVPSGSPFWLLLAPAFTPAVYPVRGQEWGHDLLPGQGMLLQGNPGVTLIANWQWVELPL